MDLLFDEGTANQLLQGPRCGELAKSGSTRIENGELNLVFDITGQNSFVIHNCYDAVQSYRSGFSWAWISCLCSSLRNT